MKKIVAIKRNDNGVTWLSGPMDFGDTVQDYVNGETIVDYLYRLCGWEMLESVIEKPQRFLDLPVHGGHEVFFPVAKIESVELRDYDEHAYDNTCGEKR